MNDIELQRLRTLAEDLAFSSANKDDLALIVKAAEELSECHSVSVPLLTAIKRMLSSLGLTAGASIQSVQRRLHVNTTDAMRLLALREALAGWLAQEDKE